MKNTIGVIGVVLVVLGGAGLALDSVSWNEERTFVDIGDFEASATVEESRAIPPAAAGGVLIAGLALTVWGFTRSP